MKNLFIIIILFSAQSIAANSTLNAYENHGFIKSQVKKHVLSQASTLGENVLVKVNNIDHRLKLRKCPAGFIIESIRPILKPGRNTLSVSCVADTPWRIFITSQITVYKKVYVANKTLTKGSVISNADLTLKKIDISNIHRHYFTKKNSIINQAVKRTIPVGSLFSNNNLTNQLLIKKGDRITITASNNGFQIQMEGIALASGSSGQRISVKNIRTKRVIQGIVDGKSSVKVQI